DSLGKLRDARDRVPSLAAAPAQSGERRSSVSEPSPWSITYSKPRSVTVARPRSKCPISKLDKEMGEDSSLNLIRRPCSSINGIGEGDLANHSDESSG